MRSGVSGGVSNWLGWVDGTREGEGIVGVVRGRGDGAREVGLDD